MRKLVSSLFVTLDGVVEDPHSWNPPYYDRELGDAVQALLAASDTHLYGRRSYEMFRSVFTGPAAGRIAHAPLMNETPKVLVSSTAENADWGQTTTITRDVVHRIRELKQQPGRTINVQASGTLVTMLLDHALLDELHLFVHPVVVGKGRRLFEGGARVAPLRLVESQSFTTGVVRMRFDAETAAGETDTHASADRGR